MYRIKTIFVIQKNDNFDLVVICKGAEASTVAHKCTSQSWKVGIIDSKSYTTIICLVIHLYSQYAM
jgi:hypothetical protein